MLYVSTAPGFIGTVFSCGRRTQKITLMARFVGFSSANRPSAAVEVNLDQVMFMEATNQGTTLIHFFGGTILLRSVKDSDIGLALC